MKKGKLMRAAGLFFALMICFTVLSRAADQMSIAVVTTERPQNMTISHEIRATGRVVQNQDVAVTTLTDQRVSAIYVSEGDQVSKGDVLFELDTALLDEKILFQQQEMEKQELQVKDAKSQKDVSSMQKANEQAQAAEQYALSANQADVQLQRAKTQLADAKKNLKNFRKKKGSAQPDGSVEEALEAAVEEKTEAYIQAQQELTSLQWKIENAVNAALQNNSLQNASFQRQESSLSQSAQEEPVICEEDGDMIPTWQEEADGGERAAELTLDAMDSQEDLPDWTGDGGASADIAAGGTSPDITIDEILPEEPSEGSLEDAAGETDGNGGQAGAGQVSGGQAGPAQISGSQTGQASQSAAEIEKSVRESYSQELAAARQKVERTLADKQSAENALAQYQQEYLAAAGTSEAEQEKQLAANVKAAQQAYVDASLAANEAAVTGGRAVQTAGIPEASNSSDRMSEITYEQMELELEKLQELRKNNGKVKATVDGQVTKLNISTGEKTVDGPAIVLADLSKGCSFVADITKEQEKYIGTGDQVTLTGSGRDQKYEELEVESVTVDETDDSIYHVKVRLPADTLELGASATMDFSRKSEAYPVTVPLTALHLDEKNQYYVLVPEEFDSIMGTEIKARRVGVTVQEKNDSYAGLAQGALSGQQEVITGSDKAVDEGSRVRIQTS